MILQILAKITQSLKQINNAHLRLSNQCLHEIIDRIGSLEHTMQKISKISKEDDTVTIHTNECVNNILSFTALYMCHLSHDLSLIAIHMINIHDNRRRYRIYDDDYTKINYRNTKLDLIDSLIKLSRLYPKIEQSHGLILLEKGVLKQYTKHISQIKTQLYGLSHYINTTELCGLKNRSDIRIYMKQIALFLNNISINLDELYSINATVFNKYQLCQEKLSHHNNYSC